MTLDNEEATVVVAENIPFSTRVDEGRLSPTGPFKVLNTGMWVLLSRSRRRLMRSVLSSSKSTREKSSVVSETSQISATQVVLAPTTRKRTAETNVQVRDGQTVVIAGLVGEDVDVSVTKVPCLGDIPMLGWLFKSEKRTTRCTNLLIFLTPHIVATP